MKHIITLFLTVLLISSFVIPASAAQNETVIQSSSYLLDNGFLVIDELIVTSQTRSSSKDYTFQRSIYHGTNEIATIAIYGNFKYDGTNVSVISKRVSRSDAYDGWSYSQTSFTSSGGTITLSAKLTKILTPSIPFTMTLSCDKDGNISYS